MGDETRPVVSARDVHLTYARSSDSPVRALRGLDIAIGCNEYVAVIGPSGCGKTSLVNVLAGLIVPDHGDVRIDGLPMAGSDDDRARLRRASVGIVFQHHRLIDSLSALDNVALPQRIDGASAEAADSRARDLLSLVAVGERAEVAIDSLSGGQRQRVAIARALANEPAVVIADEPTGALDSDGRQEIAELFARLRDHGQTILVVTHDAELAAAADRIERISDGRLVPLAAAAT